MALKIDKLKIPSSEKLAKAKVFKFAAGARFVFFIGDEGIVLVHVKDNVVQSRQFVPDAGEQNLKELRATLEKDPRAPILAVIDNMDQTYVQQTLPPVSSLSVKKLMKRRLERDFASAEIKGAILLGREEDGRKDWNFMMISVDQSPQLTVWLDFISELPNRFLGIYLVSVESEILVRNLERAMGVPKEGTGSTWKFFVSHNKVGGFRQVIMKNGRIAFTRMAQPVGESTPEVIAGSIEQEILSTIEYMRRLGFNNDAGLDLYIIASSAIKTSIDRSKFGAKNVEILTPYEVAQFLGIEGATQPTDQFGDVVLAACIGAAREHVLTLSTPQSAQMDLLYQFFIYQRVAAAAIGLGLLAYAGSLGYDMMAAYDNSANLQQAKQVAQKSLRDLRTEIKKSNLDVEKTNDMIDLYKALRKASISPLPFITRVEMAIKPPIVVKQVDWSLDGPANSLDPAPKMTAVLTLDFPGVSGTDTLRSVLKTVLNDVKTAFTDYDVSFTKLPPGYSETDKQDMTFSETSPSTTAMPTQAPEVELTIRGAAVMLPLPAKEASK